MGDDMWCGRHNIIKIVNKKKQSVLDIEEEISLCTFSFSIQIVFPVKYKKGGDMWMTL